MPGTCPPKQEQSPRHGPLKKNRDGGTSSLVVKLALGRMKSKKGTRQAKAWLEGKKEGRNATSLGKKLIGGLSASFLLHQASPTTSQNKLQHRSFRSSFPLHFVIQSTLSAVRSLPVWMVIHGPLLGTSKESSTQITS